MERCEEHRSLLGLTEYVFPAVMLVMGWPTEQQKNRTKPPRADLTHIVRENHYVRMEGPELREMLAKNTGNSDFDAWVTAFYKRKYQSDFSKEMSRSVGRYLEAYIHLELDTGG